MVTCMIFLMIAHNEYHSKNINFVSKTFEQKE